MCIENGTTPKNLLLPTELHFLAFDGLRILKQPKMSLRWTHEPIVMKFEPHDLGSIMNKRTWAILNIFFESWNINYLIYLKNKNLLIIDLFIIDPRHCGSNFMKIGSSVHRRDTFSCFSTRLLEAVYIELV